MITLHNEILSWIGEKTVTIEEIHDFIQKRLGDSYEIGDTGLIINEMVAEKLLVENDFLIKAFDLFDSNH